MKSQHKDLMRALLAGAYDKNGAAPAIAGAAANTRLMQPRRCRRHRCRNRRRDTARPSDAHAASPPRRPGSRRPTPSRHAAPRTAAAPTLDEAIRHYLEEFAATAATVH